MNGARGRSGISLPLGASAECEPPKKSYPLWDTQSSSSSESSVSSRKEELLRSRDLEDKARDAGVDVVEAARESEQSKLTRKPAAPSSTVSVATTSFTGSFSGTMVAVEAFFEMDTGDVEMLRGAGGGDSMVNGALSDTALVAKLSSSSFSSTISSGIHSFGAGSAAGAPKGKSSERNRLRDSGDMSRERTDRTLPVGVAHLAVS